MSAKKIEKDERTTFIENQSYRYGYIVLNFGILINIMYRSFRLNEAPLGFVWINISRRISHYCASVQI